MKFLEKLRDELCEELEDVTESISKGEFSVKDLEIANSLTDTIKNIDKIFMMSEGDYSGADGEWDARMHGVYGGSMPYNAGRGGTPHRDGRVRRGGVGGGSSYRGQKRDSRGRYSRDDGIDEIMEHIDEMMETAETPEQREAIERFRKQIEKA